MGRLVLNQLKTSLTPYRGGGGGLIGPYSLLSQYIIYNGEISIESSALVAFHTIGP